MASLDADYILEQGSTFVLEFQVFDEDLVPVPLLSQTIVGGNTYALSSYRFRMKLRKTKYRDTILYSCGTTQNYVVQPLGATQEFVQDGFHFVGGNTGFVRFVMTNTTTSSFKYGNHFYDIEMVKSLTGGDVVSKIIAGKMDIDLESTK